MKSVTLLLPATFLLFLTALPAGAGPAPGDASPPSASKAAVGAAPLPTSAESLSWLVGCWARTNAEPGSEENWKKAGDRLVARSRTVRGGRVGEYEDLEIRKDGGGLVYAARPNGRPETLFRLVEAGDSFAVFENRKHDFPKRISYRRAGEALTARIEGDLGTKPAPVEFPFRAKPCG